MACIRLESSQAVALLVWRPSIRTTNAGFVISKKTSSSKISYGRITDISYVP